MSVVANVAINIDAKNAAAVLDEIKRKVEAMNGAFDKVPGASPKINGLAGDLVGLAAKFVSVAAAADGLRRSISASFERSQAETRLKALTSAYGETSQATELAAKASDRFGLTQTQATKAIADVYGRLRPLGISLEDISGVYDGFNVLSKQAALSTQDAAGVFTQLSQALGSGVLRGDEFNRMAESMPSILGAVAKELGVAQTELRGMASDGKITADVVVKALKSVATQAGDLDNFLDPSQKAMSLLAKNTEEAMVQLGNLLAPAALAAITTLAKGFEFAANNMKQIVQTATFFGTFAAVLWGIQKATAAWAAAQKAAGVATAFLQALINPAALGQIAVALGAATVATVALGAAMGDGAKEAAKIDPEAQKAAAATTKIKEEADKAKIAYEAAQATAKQLAITLATDVVTAARAASAANQQQIQGLQAIGSLVNARLGAEKSLNDLQRTQLERAYDLAKTAKDRYIIALRIFQLEVNAAKIAYQQAIANITIENQKMALQERAAILKGHEIIAEGKLQILKAQTAEEARQKTIQLNEAITAQNQVIQATASEGVQQKLLNQYVAQTAELQYKNAVATAGVGLEAKLTSDKIGMSVNRAANLSSSLVDAATSSQTISNIQTDLANKMNTAGQAVQNATAAATANAYQFQTLAVDAVAVNEQLNQKVAEGAAVQGQVATAAEQSTQRIVASNNIRLTSAKLTDQQTVQSAIAKDQQMVQSATQSSNLITQAFQGIFNFVKFSLEATFGLIKWQFQAVVAIVDTLLVTPVLMALRKLGDLLKPIWENISSAFTTYVAKPIESGITNTVKFFTDAWKTVSSWFAKNVTGPITKLWNDVTQFIPKAIKSSIEFVVNTWNGAINSIKESVRGFLQYLANIINAVGDRVNVLIDAFNRLPGKDIPRVGRLSVPAFAEGGMVNKPTLALVGEAGPEYIIPASKMAEASANYLRGDRGASVIPAQVSGNAQINVTTGPVLQQGGQQYVTIGDMEKAMRKTADSVYASLRTPAGRYAVGVR